MFELDAADPPIVAPDYLEAPFTPRLREYMIKALIKAIKSKFPKVSAIAARGNSGIPLASIIAHKLQLPLIAVRKNESRHDTRTMTGYVGEGTYVIVDDLISSGETIRAILDTVKQNSAKLTCVGIFLYDSSRDDFERIPCFSITPQLRSFKRKLEGRELAGKTHKLLLNAQKIWYDFHNLYIQIDDDQFIGNLYTCYNNDPPSVQRDFIQGMLKNRPKGTEYPVVFVIDRDLYILPSDTDYKCLLQALPKKPWKAFFYIANWNKCLSGYIKDAPKDIEIKNLAKLKLRKDLLGKPPT